MNQTINNFARHTKRLLERSTRRSRPDYPALPAGMFTRVIRKEVGTTRHFFNEKSEHLVGRFIFIRPRARISRSKYTPHVGNKEMNKVRP